MDSLVSVLPCRRRAYTRLHIETLGSGRLSLSIHLYSTLLSPSSNSTMADLSVSRLRIGSAILQSSKPLVGVTRVA